MNYAGIVTDVDHVGDCRINCELGPETSRARGRTGHGVASVFPRLAAIIATPHHGRIEIAAAAVEDDGFVRT